MVNEQRKVIWLFSVAVQLTPYYYSLVCERPQYVYKILVATGFVTKGSLVNAWLRFLALPLSFSVELSHSIHHQLGFLRGWRLGWVQNMAEEVYPIPNAMMRGIISRVDEMSKYVEIAFWAMIQLRKSYRYVCNREFRVPKDPSWDTDTNLMNGFSTG